MTQQQTAADKSHSIGATVVSFDGTDAVLQIEAGGTVRWPIKRLPDGVAVGAAVRLALFTSSSERAEREQVAKSVLNEILKADS